MGNLEILQQAREKRGKSSEEMAQDFGRSEKMVRNWANGSNIKNEYREKLENDYGILITSNGTWKLK